MKWVLLALRNLRHQRGRMVLTLLGVAVAVITFAALRTVVGSWLSATEHSAQDRIATRHKVTFLMTLPRRYIDRVRALPGVEAATFANWFGGKHPVRDKEFFATIAVDKDSFFGVYDDMALPAEQLAAFRQDRQAAVVGDALAARFGWKVGDRVLLRGTIFPGSWQFTVRGIYQATRKAVDRSTFVFRWDYLNDWSNLLPAQRDQLGWIVCRVSDPRRSAALSQQIDRIFDSEEQQTVTMSEREMNNSFLGMFGAVLGAIDLVSVVIILIMALILGNTIAMGVRERTAELGMLRAIGFAPRQIALLILGEGMATGLLGAALGLLLAYPLIDQGLGRFVEENMGAMFPHFRVPWQTNVQALLLGLLLGTLAAAIPAYRALRLRVVDALRRVG